MTVQYGSAPQKSDRSEVVLGKLDSIDSVTHHCFESESERGSS